MLVGNYVKTPTIYQMEATECGAASLAMIFAYYGKYKPLEEMRVETGVSRDGCTAKYILRCARKYGLECKGYRRDAEKLREAQTPCIIHWNGNHFVVFEGFKGNYAYLNDPAMGRRKLTFEELEESFTGVMLEFTKTDAFTREKKQRSAANLIRDRLQGYWSVIFQLFYIGLLLVFPGLVLPVLSRVFLDDVLVGGYHSWWIYVVAGMAICTLLRAALTYYRSIVLQKLKSRMTLLSGYGFLRHLVRLPVHFFDQRSAGDLVGRMNNNDSINSFLAGDLAETVLNVLVAVFYLIMLFLFSWKLTLVGLCNTAICIAAAVITGKQIGSAAMKMQINNGKLYGAFISGLSISDSIKAAGAETEYTSRVLGYQAKSTNMDQELTRKQKIMSAIPDGIGQLIDVIILLVGGVLIINGEMTLGSLFAFNSLFDSFCEPVNALVGFVQKIHTMTADMSRVKDVEKYAQDERYARDNQPKAAAGKTKLSGNIELEDISFGYSPVKDPLIEHFSFKLNSGESIAFVGASGSGKSTVAKVASGLYQPWSGRVLVDGQPMSSIDRNVLSTSIATVSQNVVLFSGTVRDNLKMWNPLISDEDMIQAAKDAEIHDFIITLPGGYDYLLTEGAGNLSGGQRQRMEIARALATNPTILIMDEATSALDPLSEKAILDNLRRRGCTCVVVAHRLSAFRDCSQIVVLQNGKIVQRGNHKSMMQEDGYYKKLVQSV